MKIKQAANINRIPKIKVITAESSLVWDPNADKLWEADKTSVTLGPQGEPEKTQMPPLLLQVI